MYLVPQALQLPVLIGGHEVASPRGFLVQHAFSAQIKTTGKTLAPLLSPFENIKPGKGVKTPPLIRWSYEVSVTFQVSYCGKLRIVTHRNYKIMFHGHKS